MVEWAEQHNIHKVVLLHCLEDQYTPQMVHEVGIQAEAEFAKIQRERDLRHKLPMKMVYLGRDGLLQKNIDKLAKENQKITAIFTGKKMLDFRLSEVKQLAVPFYFID
jgi:hypothetical protein